MTHRPDQQICAERGNPAAAGEADSSLAAWLVAVAEAERSLIDLKKKFM